MAGPWSSQIVRHVQGISQCRARKRVTIFRKCHISCVVAAVNLFVWASILYSNMPSPPIINDITTDLSNPVEFQKNSKLNPYPESFKSQVSSYYTDLKSLSVVKPKDTVYSACLAAAGQMPRWKIDHEDRTAGYIEGVAITKLLRFRDDWVVRLTDSADGCTVVDMRSKSRLGRGDLGANAARIKEFFGKVQAQLQ
jgi:uncharacterized protein (DUF1499 family)